MLVSKSITSSFTIYDRKQSLESGVAKSTPFERFLKRIFSYDNIKQALDLSGAVLMLVLLSPIMVVIALVIKLTSPGPVIFKQQRLTQGGKLFTMYKFRTMYSDAEYHTGAVWASSEDPRVTKTGKFLRLSRLDEVPQLFNVIRGEMSLVGPRPERPELAAELERQIPLFRRRIEVKAGITGLAQIASGYAATVGSYRTKIAFDIEYVENRSILLDLKIAWRTLKVILSGEGAR